MSSTEELAKTVAELADRVRSLEAAAEIRALHHKYGYYLDKCLYEEVVDLYSADGEVVFIGGVYRGRAGVERLYLGRFRQRFTRGHNGPVRGFLLDHIMMQDVVTVAPDGRTAKARIRTLMQAGVHESAPELRERVSFEQWWEGGVYENEYVLEGGVWKIKRLGYHPFWHADYELGWARTAPMSHLIPKKTYPEDPLGPDELIEGFEFFPGTDVVPFHYPHPTRP
ncbi:nuclear transport factor 2 family protein [Amycolatopsis alkalitolerans]|uniref:nuclear transport factor 2 family protein n=1 Tax=Amycolatopsis alkalitolerans TaxID=2547244 RepID=UPI0013588D09|nr:nuclear transport factor 2 family protein [Amycolatopsis alkalitolerans]